MNHKAVYPGTFDPITLGHEDLIRRAARLFDTLVVAVADSSAKRPFFTRDERVDMARRVLINLMENSVKYTPPDGQLEAGASHEGEWVHMWVKDNGPGIPPAAQDRIFDKFTRLRGANKSGGLGIGLAFCRLAVVGHGGQIWVDATLRNQGDIDLSLYDVGSESAWKAQIQMQNSKTGAAVWDNDDHGAGTSGTFVNGTAPFQFVKSFSQVSGLTNLRFYRASPDPKIKTVVNGQSPTLVPSNSFASIAYAYLDDAYRIVNLPTNRVLVLLEDGNGTDRDYDDYVAILEGPSIVPPDPPGPASLSISGGTQVSAIPQGNSGNAVLATAGIGMDGGSIWIDGTLDVLGNGAMLTLYDVGSESHWINQIRLGNASGPDVVDLDDHFRGTGTTFTNGPAPYQVAGTVTQGSGIADFEFRRIDPTPEYQIVVNGQSPMMMVPGYDFASIALAYLSDSNQIVAGPTNRVLVLLEDGGTDRDYDDYVGILAVTTSPPSYPVSPNALAFGNVRKGTTSASKTVTITNYGSGSLAIGSIKLSGASPGQFAKTSQCPTSLPAGASCTVKVTFTPKFRSVTYATLDLTIGGELKIVGLYGTGT